METSIAEGVKEPCAFIIRITDPLQTLIKILDYLASRKLIVETLQMHNLGSGESVITLYCKVESDGVKHTIYGLERIVGILKLELLESKTSNIDKI